MSLKFESILIVTYGRSGSTLLQGILNSIDGVLIRGENSNFFYSLYQSYQRLIRTQQYSGEDPTKPWYGSQEINLDLFLQQLSSIGKNILVQDRSNVRCYGFKEIRYAWSGDEIVDYLELLKEDKFEQYLDFLTKIFPQPCFIFNTRKLEAVLASQWWTKGDAEQHRQQLLALENKFQSFTQKNSDRCFSITYEDLIYKTAKLQDLFNFLGATYQDNTIDSILARSHSYGCKTFKESTDPRIVYEPLRFYANFLADILVDNLPPTISPHEPFNFQGVVIPKQDRVAISSVKAITEERVYEAKLGIESPYYGKKYPHIDNSNLARFQIDNLVVEQEAEISLVAYLDNGEQIKFAKIKPLSK